MPSAHEDCNRSRKKRGNGGDDSEASGPGGALLGALLVAVGGLAFIAGAASFAGSKYLMSSDEDTNDEAQSYYRLPPLDETPSPDENTAGQCTAEVSAAPTKTDAETHAKTTRSPSAESSSLECGSREGGRCHLCVCCYTRPNSFMFVSCRHLCLCEKCLIQLGRSYENNTLHSRFKGPVRLPCPLCRTVGYVVKTFIP